MRLSNLEEGSYNNTPEPKKMQVTVADKKANTEAWKRYQAGDSRYEFKNPTTEAEVTEAGGYYTQPVYDMIEKHGYEKVMHELLTSLHADVIQDFISRADLEEGGEGSGPKHKEVTVTKDGKSKVVKKIAAKVFTDAGWKVEEGKSPHKKGTAKYKKHMAAMHAESKDEPIQVREAGSPWTTTGKHPEKMTTDELWAEIAVFDHIQDRGETLSPKDMMRLDSLFSYMDTAEMNEAIKLKADSMMESAVWKSKRNK